MPSDSSTQPSVMINFTQIQKSGTSVKLEGSNGYNILTLEPKKEYQSIVMSSPGLKIDGTYNLFVGDTKIVSFTMSKTSLRISDTGEEIT